MSDDFIKDFITAKETARRLGVGLSAVTNAARQGRLPYVEVHGKRLFRVTEVEEYRIRSQPEGKKSVGRPRSKP